MSRIIAFISPYGRLSGLQLLLSVVIVKALTFLVVFGFSRNNIDSHAAWGLLFVVYAYLLIICLVKRCRDIGRHPLFAFVVLIPVFGFVYLIIASAKMDIEGLTRPDGYSFNTAEDVAVRTDPAKEAAGYKKRIIVLSVLCFGVGITVAAGIFIFKNGLSYFDFDNCMRGHPQSERFLYDKNYGIASHSAHYASCIEKLKKVSRPASEEEMRSVAGEVELRDFKTFKHFTFSIKNRTNYHISSIELIIELDSNGGRTERRFNSDIFIRKGGELAYPETLDDITGAVKIASFAIGGITLARVD